RPSFFAVLMFTQCAPAPESTMNQSESESPIVPRTSSWLFRKMNGTTTLSPGAVKRIAAVGMVEGWVAATKATRRADPAAADQRIELIACAPKIGDLGAQASTGQQLARSSRQDRMARLGHPGKPFNGGPTPRVASTPVPNLRSTR